MNDINRVVLSGRLVKEPEIINLNNGTTVLNMSIANSQYAGTGKENYVSFYDCVIFGKRAEALSQYLHKGQLIFVEGSLRQDRWESEGRKRSRIKIVLDNVVLTGKGKSVPEKAPVEDKQVKSADGFVDDIPF